MGPFAYWSTDCPRVYRSTVRVGGEAIMAFRDPKRVLLGTLRGSLWKRLIVSLKPMATSYHTHTLFFDKIFLHLDILMSYIDKIKIKIDSGFN